MLLSATLLLGAPAPPRPIETPCGGVPGEPMTYSVQRDVHRPAASPDAAPVERHMTSSFTLVIQSVELPVLTAQATLREAAGEVEPALQAVLARLAQEGAALEPPPAQLAVDATTHAVSIGNVDAWVTYAERTADLVLAALQAERPDLTPDVAARIRATMVTPSMATQSVQRGVFPVLSYWCASFEGPEVRYQAEQPNPLGGAPLQVSGVIQVRRTRAAVRMHVEEDVTLDASAWVQAMLPPDAPAEQIEPLRAALSALQTHSVTDVVVDGTTGLVERFDTLRTVGAPDGPDPATDRVVIQRVK